MNHAPHPIARHRRHKYATHKTKQTYRPARHAQNPDLIISRNRLRDVHLYRSKGRILFPSSTMVSKYNTHCTEHFSSTFGHKSVQNTKKAQQMLTRSPQFRFSNRSIILPDETPTKLSTKYIQISSCDFRPTASSRIKSLYETKREGVRRSRRKLKAKLRCKAAANISSLAKQRPIRRPAARFVPFMLLPIIR